MDESVGVFKYDKDTRRMHRYLVTTDDGVTGTLYIPKDAGGIPRKIILDNARYKDEEESNSD